MGFLSRTGTKIKYTYAPHSLSAFSIFVLLPRGETAISIAQQLFTFSVQLGTDM